MIRWKIYWRCEWVSWQTKYLEKIKNKKNIYGYLINYKYFNNLNDNGNMVGTSIMAGIYSFPYPYPVNAGILRQNGNGFE